MIGGRTSTAFAVIGLAVAHLRRSPVRTALAVVAVALAVLSVTLLASLGVGVFDVGQQSLDETNSDLWITGEPLDASHGGTENSITGAHAVAAQTMKHEDVRLARPMAIHATYVGADPNETVPLTAVGVRATHGGFEFEEGEGFSVEDDEPVIPLTDPGTSSVVLDPRTADQLNVSVGDTIHLGTSRQATYHEFTVVGTSRYYSNFIGEPTITVPLAELQGVAGTRGTDRASFITVMVASDADHEAVRDDLQSDFPAYDVRTGKEQFASIITDRSFILTSSVAFVVLAIVGGIVLVVNLFVLVAHQQRQELAALRAIGLSRWVLAGILSVQGFLICVIGGLLALGATPVLVDRLNRLTASLVGFDQLLQTPPEVYAIGVGIALVVGTIAAVITGWYAGRYARFEHLST